MGKLDMHTANLADENYKKLSTLFPNAVTETIDENGQVVRAIDADILRQEISKAIVDGREERYQFTWPDKKKAILTANAPIAATLRPCREESVDFDNTQNLYIEGDNLDVLKLLRETYLGKVKMIYIDPPYNTGKDFIYEDDFAEDVNKYLEQSSQFDLSGNRLVQNPETIGRFHTCWLNMMYPRLKIAKDLLSDDGVIFISIDENEVENLKKICLEIFGAQSYIGTIVLQTATDNNPGQIKIEHEYILCLCRDKKLSGNWYAEKEEAKLIQNKYEELKKLYGSDLVSIQVELRNYIKKNSEKLKGITHYDNVDKHGVFHDGDIANTSFGGYEYDIIHPKTGKVCKMPEKGYRFPKETMIQMLKEDNIMFGDDEMTLPKPKIRLEDVKDMLRSVIYEDGRSSTKHFESLMARDIFQNPKSETILSRLINFICKDGDIIMDFFSGSGTIAEATFLSELKGKKLDWILVQLRENLDETIKSASLKGKKTIQNAIKFLDSIGKPHYITEIGKERIRRAGKKIKEESPMITQNLDIGFRVLKLDSSNMEDVYYAPEQLDEKDLFQDNVKPDRTAEDLLFQVMLDKGIPLSSKIESKNIDGKEVFYVDGNYLIACFDKDVTEETITAIAKEKPYYFVMRDPSNAPNGDSLVTNFEQIFATYSPNTDRKVL